jgi:hypothetical protein
VGTRLAGVHAQDSRVVARRAVTICIAAVASGVSLCSQGAVTAQASGPVAAPPVDVSAVNLLASCPFDGVTAATFPNTEVEPWLVVNPTDEDNLVGIYQQDRYATAAKGNVVAVSKDGGAHWSQLTLPGLSRCTGGEQSRATDPWLSFSPDGTLHASSLAGTIGTPPQGFPMTAIIYHRTSDGGTTWSEPVVLQRDADGRALNDKESIAADPRDPDRLYVSWTRFQIPSEGSSEGPGPVYFTSSSDGGDTWRKARAIYDPGPDASTGGGQILVTPSGHVAHFFTEVDEVGDGALLQSVIVSKDHGRTWSQPYRIARVRSVGLVDPEGLPCPPTFNTSITPCPIATAFIPHPAVDKTGRLVVVWQDAGFSDGEEEGIVFSESRNGGRSWSRLIPIHQDGQAFSPAIVADARQDLTVTYYDFRNEGGDPSQLATDYWAVRCDRHCSRPESWGEEVRLTPASFDGRSAPGRGGLGSAGYFLGDYFGLAATGTDALALFASGVGSGETDIFFSRLSPAR